MTNVLTLRHPFLRVTVDGREVTDRLSGRVSLGYTLRTAEADVEAFGMPSWAHKWSIVTIEMGATRSTSAVRFVGFLIEQYWTLYPRFVRLTCRGFLIKAQITQCNTPGGVDMSNGGVGAKDEDQVSTMLDNCGLTTDVVGRDIGGTGTLIGTVATSQDRWNDRESGQSFIDKLDAISLGYRTFDTIGGTIRRAQITANPQPSAAFTFTEGVDIYRATNQDTILEARNRVVVTGFNLGSLTVSDTQQQASPFIPSPTGYVTQEISNPLIERSLAADAGDGLSCEDVAKWQLGELNRDLSRVVFTTHRDDPVAPGTTIAVAAPDRLGVSRNYWVQQVDIQIDRRNNFTQVLTCLAGIGSAAAVTTNPLADFAMDVTGTESVLLSGSATTIWEVQCRATPTATGNPIAGYAWTAAAGSPSTGALPTFSTSFSGDLSAALITLEVLDSTGLTGSATKAVPSTSVALYTQRALYLAATGYIEAWDGQTWRNYVATSTVVGNGPVWAAATAALSSPNYLATAPVSVAPFGGAAVSATWIETDVSTSRVLVGSSDGRLALSGDGGITFGSPIAGPDANAVLRCVISSQQPGQWFVLTSAGLYQTLTGGASWITLASAEAGETFRDLCVSWNRIMVAMSGGRLLIDASGTAQTFATLSPVVSDVLAVTADIREDRFLCYDALKRTFYHDADGGTSLAQMATLADSATVQARGLWRDGAVRGLLYYAAGADGVYKRLGAFEPDPQDYRLRQPGLDGAPADAVYTMVGADGLLAGPPPTPAGSLFVIDGAGTVKYYPSLSASAAVAREGGLPGGYVASCITSDAADKSRMYLAIGSSVYTSTDEGRNWTLAYTFNGTVRHIYANATVAGEVWAGLDGTDSGVWVSTDYGATWTKNYSTGDFRGTYYVPWVTASGLSVWASFGDTLWYDVHFHHSEDGGATWSADVAPGGRGAAHCQAVDAPTKGALWGSILASGPFITTDDWASYTDRSGAIGTGVGVVYSPDGSFLLACKSGDGIYRSINDGATWSRAYDDSVNGFPGYLAMADVRHVAYDGDLLHCYAGGQSGHVLYSTDGGLTWGTFQVTDNTQTVVQVYVAGVRT